MLPQTGEAATAPRTQPLIADYLDYVEKVLNYSPKTVRSYRYSLGLFLEWIGKRPITEVTLHEIDTFFKGRAEKISPSSMNTERSIMRSFLLYVDRYRGHVLMLDPAMIRNVKVEKKKIPFFELEEINYILKNLEDEEIRLIVYMLFATGMRIGELTRLTVEDFYDTEITVRGKGGKKRVVPVPPDLSEMLSDYMRQRRISSGCIFRQQYHVRFANQPYSISGLRKRIQQRLLDLGIKSHPHMFRHSVATTLLREGMDIRSVQTFLGHEHIQTTMRYTHVTDKSLREAYQRAFPAMHFK